MSDIDDLFGENDGEKTAAQGGGLTFAAPLNIATQAIRDGSQALLHDGYDVQAFQEAVSAYPNLAAIIAKHQPVLITATALIRDIYWSFSKQTVLIEPVVPMTPAHQFNRRIVEQLIETTEHRITRESGTVGDILNSAIATIGAASSALSALSAATVAEINHLHEMESGAATLFKQAEALSDEAEQASGDRAEALYRQAEEARAEAEQRQQAIAEAAPDEDQIESAVEGARRAARKGIAAATEEIENIAAAVNTFGGGYGPGPGLGNGHDDEGEDGAGRDRRALTPA